MSQTNPNSVPVQQQKDSATQQASITIPIEYKEAVTIHGHVLKGTYEATVSAYIMDARSDAPNNASVKNTSTLQVTITDPQTRQKVLSLYSTATGDKVRIADASSDKLFFQPVANSQKAGDDYMKIIRNMFEDHKFEAVEASALVAFTQKLAGIAWGAPTTVPHS